MSSLDPDVPMTHWVSDMMKDLNRSRLEDLLTEILEANGVNLKNGDGISLSFNGKGELVIDFDNSVIGGTDNMNKFLFGFADVTFDKSQLGSAAADAEIDRLLAEDKRRYQTLINISSALNTAKTPNGQPLNTALREQLLWEKFGELGTVYNDESRPLSFSFQHNADTGRNEIGKVQLSSPWDAAKKEKYVYFDGEAFAQMARSIIKKHYDELGIEYPQSGMGLGEEYRIYQRMNDDGTISFSREHSVMRGVDAAKKDEIFTEIEAAFEKSGCFYIFESSKPVRYNNVVSHVQKWNADTCYLQTGWSMGNLWDDTFDKKSQAYYAEYYTKRH